MPLSDIGIRAVFTGTEQMRQGFAMIRHQSAQASTSINSLTRNVNSSNSALLNLGGTINSVGLNIRNFGNQLSNIGLRMSALVTAPVLFAGAAIAQTGTAFETEMVKIINLADVAEEQVMGWSNQLLALAPQLGQIPTELAAGLYFVASSGIRDAAEAMGTLETAAKGSAIGLGETQDVAQALTSAMITFGITSERAADILIATVREGQGEADQLASTLGRVLGIAGAVGASFEDVGAFIATFTRLGVPAEVAVTSLRTALTNLINPTAEAKETLAEYGLTAGFVLEQVGEQGLARTLVQLMDRFQGNNEAITAVFGSARALAGVLGTAVEQSEAYVEISDIMEASNGALESSFERVRHTAGFAFDRLIATVDVLKVQLSRALLPLLVEAANRLSDFFDQLGRFAEANPMVIQLAAIFGVLAAAIGPVLFLGGAVISTFGIMITTVGFLIASLGTTVALIAGPLIAAFTAVNVVIGTFATALALTAGDIERKMGPAFDRLINRAKNWGANLIIEFANGMIGAFVIVVNALNSLGALLAHWLAPGSPPRIVPDLDVWGREAMNEYLRGWTEADFGILSDLGNTISSFIQAAGEAAGLEDTVVAGMVLETTEDLIGAMEIFRQTGEITDEVLGRITDTLSSGQQDVEAFIVSMFNLQSATQAVANAQEQLNAANQHFDNILDPLNARLSELNAMRTEWQRQLEEQQLEAILDDPRASDEAKRRARLMLERLDILREIDRVEQQREDEIAPLEAQLKLAQDHREVLEEQAAAQRELIRLQTELNQLLADTFEKADADAAVAIDPFDAFPEDFDPSDPFGLKQLDTSQLENIANPITTFIDTIKEELEPALNDARTALDTFSSTWALVFTTISDIDELPIEEIGGRLGGAFVKGVVDFIADTAPQVRDRIVDEFFNPDKYRFKPGEDVSIQSILEKLGFTFGPEATEDSVSRGFVQGLTDGLYNSIADWWSEIGKNKFKLLGLEMFTFFIEAITTPRPIPQEFIDSDLGEDIIGIFAGTRYSFLQLVEAFSGESRVIENFQTTWRNLGNQLKDIGISGFFETIWNAIARPRDIPENFDDTPLGRWILQVFEVFNFENFAKLPGELQRVWGRIPQVLEDIWSESWEVVTGWVEDLTGDVVAFFEDLYTDLVGASIVVDLVDEIVDLFTNLPQRILDGMVNFVSRVSQPFIDLKNNLIGPDGIVATAITGIINLITGIPDLLAAIPFDWEGILTIFANLGTTLATRLLEAFEEFPLLEGLIQLITDVAGGVGDFLQGINPFSEIEDSFDSPDVSSGGSIAPDFSSQLPGPLQPVHAPVMGGAGGNQVNVDLGGQNIYNGMDVATLRTIIRQEVARAINL